MLIFMPFLLAGYFKHAVYKQILRKSSVKSIQSFIMQIADLGHFQSRF